MKRTRLSKVLALTLVFLMVMSSTVFGATGRVISNTLTATVNVGAVTEKVHNETQDLWYGTIQAAIDAAANNDVIEVGEGTFTETVQIDKPIQLIGSGTDNTVLSPAAGQKHTLIVGDVSEYGLDLTGTLIQGFTINTPVPDPSDDETSAIYLTAKGSVGSEIVIDGNDIIGLEDETNKHNGIVTPYSSEIQYIKVTNNDLSNLSYGMYFNSGSNILVDGNTIDTTIRNGINFYGKPDFNCDNITVTNNTLDNIDTAVDFYSDQYDSGISFYLYGESITVNNNTIVMAHDGRMQIYYYTETATEADVDTEDELKEALSNEEITTINVIDDFSVANQVVVSRPVTINGGNHTITFTGNADGWNGDYVMQVYNTDATIDGIKLTGGDAGLLVNASEVTLTGTIDVSGNEFGGIEASKGSASGLENPVLTVTGATFVNTTEEYGLPTIWEDGVTATTYLVANSDQFTLSDTVKPNQVQYYLVSNNTINPVDYIELEGTIDGVAFVDGTATISVEEGADVSLVVNATVQYSLFTSAELVVELDGTEITLVDNNINPVTEAQTFTIALTGLTAGTYTIEIYVIEK
ncbi:nitrogen fixation protein FixH [Sedimentibacter acidaminivorans]|jgi:nitrogen fixation protein FixH|uniref:Nitrogen fixation protein FixH n=1 Tax=Sedimentibacter acidaminivorans TaxID=913099 RepID=A0ABS4G984_9FIRM|nr:right-handed parallel beta-helix repeat-containing protein [Sedimentibacter acidaminivorans]MBP1924248.1 nitrogen fixation protein FixH [Sedimentibacter acidaminivorans]